MKKDGLDLCDVLLLNFFVRPMPDFEKKPEYVGMTEKELREKYTDVHVLSGRTANDLLLEIRLPEATLTCIMNACRICKRAFLFPDYT